MNTEEPESADEHCLSEVAASMSSVQIKQKSYEIRRFLISREVFRVLGGHGVVASGGKGRARSGCPTGWRAKRAMGWTTGVRTGVRFSDVSDITNYAQMVDYTFERHYRIGELSRMWALGRDTVRKLV
jgi:hypothetical protein